VQELFNLIIFERNDEKAIDEKVEEYLGVSMNPESVRYLPRLLEQNSTRVKVKKDGLGAWPTSIPLVGGPVSPSPLGSDGSPVDTLQYSGNELQKTGIYALKKADLFNLLCIPPPERTKDTAPSVYAKAVKLCVDSRAMLIVDPPAAWGAGYLGAGYLGPAAISPRAGGQAQPVPALSVARRRVPMSVSKAPAHRRA
jgi:hypothetical protein